MSPFKVVLIIYLAGSQAYSYNLNTLVQDVYKVQSFETILILENEENHQSSRSVFEELVQLRIPVISLAGQSSYYLRGMVSNQLLAMAVLSEDSDRMLTVLSETLTHMRQVRIIFVIQNETVLADLFHFCWTHKMINAIAIYDSQREDLEVVHSYTHFPSFALETLAVDENLRKADIFKDRLSDLKGMQIRTVWGDTEPRTIRYTGRDGKEKIQGLTGNFLEVFAQKHNAQLVEVTKGSYPPEVRELFKLDQIDLSARIMEPEFPLQQFSYPLDIVISCLAIPIEQKIPLSKCFVLIFDYPTWVCIGLLLVYTAIVLKLSAKIDLARSTLICLQGIIFVSMPALDFRPFRIKFIYCHLFAIGFVLTAYYNSNLNSFLTSYPTEKPLRTSDDLLESKVKILVIAEEIMDALAPDEVKKYRGMLKETDFETFFVHRNSLNTTYGYSMPSDRWYLIDRQQRMLSQPTFRYTQICYVAGYHLCFPLSENSPYVQILNDMIRRVHDVGLVAYWKHRGFYEMVESKKMKLVDLSLAHKMKPIDFENIKWVFYILFMVHLGNTVVFVLEMLSLVSFKKFFYRCKSNVSLINI